MKKLTLILALCLLLAVPFQTALAKDKAEALLSAIDSVSEHGMIINCEYVIEDNTIEDMIETMGEPDEQTYVESAKGTYATFKSAKVVAGFNKGDQIFELRSSDKRLHHIRLDDVEDYFGESEHTTHTGGDYIISYTIENTGFDIRFVFDKPDDDEDNPVLKHYNVVWPEGTVNQMAGDDGRDW